MSATSELKPWSWNDVFQETRQGDSGCVWNWLLSGCFNREQIDGSCLRWSIDSFTKSQNHGFVGQPGAIEMRDGVKVSGSP